VLAELDISTVPRAGTGEFVDSNLYYVSGNYKKKEGYKRSIELAREYGLYRQHYCGCCFSEREAAQAAARRSQDGGSV
jgi:predicted adenine nucleotide alpha hydrolase (AANH) superfamily ATPase